MKKALILLLLISFCGGTAEPLSTSVDEKQLIVEEELPNEEKQILEEESKLVESSEDSVNSIFWGATDAQPEVYAASDVSQETIEITAEWVDKAIELWGNYGPLEIWIVGEGKDEVIALDEKWCEVRTQKDPTWNKKWDCANGDPYDSGDGWSPFYRYVNEGGAAVSSYIRDYIGYYFNALIMSSKYPGPEEEDYKKVILHEYFHVYQLSLSRDFMSSMWMIEGQAATIEALYLREFYNDSDYIENFLNNVDYVKAIENIETYEEYESAYDSFGKYGDITIFMNLVLTKILQSNGLTEIASFKLVFNTFWMERNGNEDWKTDFKTTFGLDVDTFYQALTQYIDDPLAVLPSNQLELSSFLELSK
jgi:hypothetical protein